MYNANLDRSLANRKTKNELRRDVKKWEEEMSRKKKPVVEDLVKYQVRVGVHIHNAVFLMSPAEINRRLNLTRHPRHQTITINPCPRTHP